jgi:hypothetical protein
MSGLPEVWKYSKGPRISIKSHYQAMAIQGLGYRLEIGKDSTAKGLVES